MNEFVVISGDFPPDIVGRLPEFECHRLTPEELHAPASREILGRASALLVTGRVPVTASLVDHAPRLRVVSVRAVGYDRVDVDACSVRGIPVCHTPGVLDGAVADLTMLLVLAGARRLRENLQTTEPTLLPPGTAQRVGSEIRGRTLGILGYGRIGSLVARTASAGFGMTVIHHSRGSRGLPAPDGMPGRRVSREELFRSSDFLSVHLPLTDATRRSVGEAELRAMRSSALLVNTSRGEILDEPALMRALDERWIAGAALDVTWQEPLPAEHPFRRMPNVIVTPHIGSATAETRAAMLDLALTNLRSVLTGLTPVACVNPQTLADPGVPAR
ncbi:2-hydroxyacid dehydrogenase [Micromonospora sp. NPDC048830]|uniref:2-hydroxyacid dehydrogenase n=1 Tax=Micromonospora sp. NPDC048830 TaxID=3364257 RepID=UPI00371524FD